MPLLPPPTPSADLHRGSTAHRWMVFWSSVSLVVAVASMSAVGPLFLFLQQRGISPILACAWRNQTMVLFLLPPAIIEWMRVPAKQREWDSLRIEEDEPASPSLTKKTDADSGGREMQQPAYSYPTAAGGAMTPTLSTLRVSPARSFPSAVGLPSPAAKKGWHVSWYLLVVCITWAVSLVLWVVALPYTSTPRASLFCSTYPLLLVPYMKFVQKIPVSGGEVLGVCISFLGILTTEMSSIMNDQKPASALGPVAASRQGLSAGIGVDPASFSIAAGASAELDGSGWTVGQRQLYGDALCVGSSLLLGLNILFAEKTRKVLPLFSYSCSSAFIVLLMLIAGAIAFEGASLSMDPVHGVFGWVVGSMLWINLVFGFVVGMIGVLGFNFAVKYVNPLIFSSTQLLDPGLTGLLSWLAGLEGWPERSTFVGVGIVTIGIGFITVYQHRREHAGGPKSSGGLKAPMSPAAAPFTPMAHSRKLLPNMQVQTPLA